MTIDQSCYYPCCAVLDGQSRYFLWYSGDPDGIVLLRSKIRTFPTKDDLEDYCAANRLALSGEPTATYDLDKISEWISAPSTDGLDIKSLLNTWNLMDDFYKSLGRRGAIDDEVLDLHEKLSLANFAVDIPEFFNGKVFQPQWTQSDLMRIAAVLDETTSEFKKAL